MFRKSRVNKYIIKELVRKVIHLTACLVPWGLQHYKVLTLTAFTSILLLYVVAEYLRCKGKQVVLLSAITKIAARKRDENRFVLDPVTLVVGILLSALFFNLTSATIAIYALAFGDGIASVAGKLLGKHTIPFSAGKTFEGSFACFGAIFASTYLVTNNMVQSLIIALVGTALELLPIKDLDNVLIPVGVAFVCSYCLGIG